MQSRGEIPIKCFKWKNPGEGFELKKKPWGGFSPGEGFSNCYNGNLGVERGLWGWWRGGSDGR